MAVNGMYIVQGEMNQVVMALRRSRRWAGGAGHHDFPQLDQQDPLLRGFSDLRDVMNTVSDLSDVHPSDFLSPFLEVIRSEHTSGPVTGLTLSSVAKFLSYGLIDPNSITAPSAVEQIAASVTHARFVGTDPGSDEVVLLKILQVLRTLLLTPVGTLLTNDSVCEILQSCFRICFETRLSELLRRAAENTLSDMIQLLFTRLPTFKEDPRDPYIRKLKMKAASTLSDPMHTKRRKRYKHKKRVANVSEENSGVQSEAQSDSLAAEKLPGSESGDKAPSDENVVSPSDEECSSHKPEADTGRVRLDTPRVVDVHENLVAMQQSTEALSDDETTTVLATAKTPSAISVHSDEVGQEEEHGEQGRGVEFDVQVGETMTVKSIEQHNRQDAGDDGEIVGARDEAQNEYVEDKPVPVSERVGETSDSVELGEEPMNHFEGEKEPFLEIKQRVNSQGVRFVGDGKDNGDTEDGGSSALGPLVPYGLPCIRELFRFLISLSNPLEKQNTEGMVQMGLNLLTVALEASADHLGKYTLLLPLVKNDLCRNLLHLLFTDRMPLFAATLRACFILFESLRSHLKLQLEKYLSKLMDLVVNENPKISFEQKEMALEALVQLWRIPGFVTELYLNYDCDLYCSNLFEDLTKLLSKNSFPLAGIYSTHLLSLDALLTVIDTIESNCHYRTTLNLKDAPKLRDVCAFDNLSRKERSYELPPSSGYCAGTELRQQKANIQAEVDTVSGGPTDEKQVVESVNSNRAPSSEGLPSHEDLIVKKKRKKLLGTGTELFNQGAKKGITFLQEHGLLQTPLNPAEVVEWLKSNPRLDKKEIGDYVSNKKYIAVMEAFVKSFNFEHVRIDDALRAFLETFRLPGEAPVISMLLEHFADHWHRLNEEPFANTDAAFTLAYAVIMLNVDQHNTNAKKQNEPMTVAQFKNNLRGVNGGENFDDELLEDIYHAIKSEEIVMPAEHTGLVKENYLWKVLLRRSTTVDGVFHHAPNGLYDHDLFALIWGPTVAAISYVFDKSSEDSIITKSLNGFRKCAAIAAHYAMSDVFDNLIISLGKFSTIMSIGEHDNFAVAFGENPKAHLATKTMFHLVHLQGDILREGWKNILECLLQLYRVKLLPKCLTEAEDYVDPKGWVSIVPEKSQKSPREEPGGLFSSFYTLLGSSNDLKEHGKAPSPEEQQLNKLTEQVIEDSHPEQIVTDSRYLTSEALMELLKALIAVSNAQMQAELPEANQSNLVFYLELIINVCLENKDRLSPYWPTVKSQLARLISSNSPYVTERAVVGLLRIVSRLLFREELSGQMLQSLSLITLLPVPALKRLANQLAFGLHQLIRTNAADIHRRDDWKLLFVLLEISGAAAYPPHLTKDARTTEKTSSQPISGSAEDLSVRVGSSDTEAGSSRSPSVERGYTSDTEVGRKGSEWAYVDDKGEKVTKHVTFDSALSYNLAALELQANLHTHNPSAFLKCCETLAFIVRDAAHVTPENFESCLSCLRTFAEASLNGGRFHKTPSTHEHHVSPRGGSKKKRRGGKASSAEQALSEEKEAELKRLAENYHQVALQLLDLAHTLHVKVADMYYQWQAALPGLDTSAPALWKNAWCPLLQTLARFCCDNRKQIRNTALTYLQRALLIHDLHASEPAQWEQCFTQILFPLLAQLQRNVGLAQADPSGVEEAKCRALQLLSKVFLQHLNPLLSLEDFGALWATILEFNGQFYQSDEKGDVLLEAIPETMKNMLLVMETAGVFSTVPKLSQLTRDYVQPFLPNLLDELFPKEQGGPEQSQVIASSPESGGPAGHPGVPADKSGESASTEGNVHQSHQTCEHSDEDSQMVVIKPEDVETQGERVEIPQGAEMSHDELEEIVVDRPEPGRVPPASAASVFAHDVSPSQVILHPPTCGESGSSQDKNLSGLFSSTSTVLPSNVVLHPPSADTYFTRSPVTPDCKIDENSRPEAGGSPARSMKMEA